MSITVYNNRFLADNKKIKNNVCNMRFDVKKRCWSKYFSEKEEGEFWFIAYFTKSQRFLTAIIKVHCKTVILIGTPCEKGSPEGIPNYLLLTPRSQIHKQQWPQLFLMTSSQTGVFKSMSLGIWVSGQVGKGMNHCSVKLRPGKIFGDGQAKETLRKTYRSHYNLSLKSHFAKFKIILLCFSLNVLVRNLARPISQ